MTLYQITSCVREVGGQVWHIDFADFGTQIRADVGISKVRVVVPKPGQTPPFDIPSEGASPFYLVDNLDGLRNWLESIKPQPAAV